ncbi:MAG: hypothetical protein U9O20_01030 [Patescibacteria group bacterium]|nr:hypothetical protein [Patescibacteria group bacterium]
MECEKYVSKKVMIKLYRTNIITGEEMITKHNRKFDSDGMVTFGVGHLNHGMLYEFKAKIKKQSDGDYSDKSKKRLGNTKYIG